MNKADILTNSVNTEEFSLSKLNYWLQYEKYTLFLGAGIGWFPVGLILTCLSIIAVVFTPYMLWHLVKAKWYKSVITFCSIVILPFIIFQFIQTENSIIDFLLGILPLVTFYFCIWILSYMIKKHLNKIKTIKEWEKKQVINKSF